ncbi:hypothetical protein D3C80_1300890 [compost metagenome]
MLQLTVDPGAQGQIVRIGYIGGVDDPRAYRGGGVAVLHAQIGPVVVFQIVTDGVVVADGVAGHILQGVFAFDVPCRFADNCHQFALVVHVGNAIRAPSDLVVAGVRTRRLDEGQRFGRWRKGQLSGVVGVVQAQGKHVAIGGR